MEATAPEDTESPGSRWPIGLRILLLCAALVTLAVAASTALTWLAGERLAGQAVREALEHGASAQDSATARRLSLLERTIQLVAADPALVTYVATALGDDLGLGGEGGADAASIGDLLAERREQFGFDFGMVLDVDAAMVARSDGGELFAEGFAEDPMIGTALGQLAPQSGFWRMQDNLYQAAVMPLDQDGFLVGFLLLAQRVDEALCREVAEGSGADIAFWLPGEDGPRLAAGSMPAAVAQELALALSASAESRDALALGQAREALSLRLGGEDWLVRMTPTAGEGLPELGMTTTLASSTAAASGFRALRDRLLLAGAGAVLLALLASVAFSRRALAPVRRMAEAAELAAEGDYSQRLNLGGSDELGRLGRAFDSLLSMLREKQDIEGYVATFSRFVPDAAEPAPPAAPEPAAPVSCTGVVLAADLVQPNGEDAGARLARVAGFADSVRSRGGRPLAGDGLRQLAGFSGPRAAEQAMRCAAGLLAGADAAAMALVEGEWQSAEAEDGGRLLPQAFGPAPRMASRLLADAAPGVALVARALGDHIRGEYGTAPLAVGQGSLSGRRYYQLRAQAVESLAEPAQAGGSQADTVTIPAVPSAAGDGMQPGRLLSGRYELVAKLGEGGMGVVWKARDRELDDVVALKMLKPGALADREQLERLKDEIRLARRITHPNVLRTYDFGEAGGLPFISMEYVRGVTLRALLEQSGRLPYSAGLRIARQLAAGLAAAHAVGVLHRDIKPENLILEAGGNARLMDFGIARPARRGAAGHTAPGMYLGTPRYSPPEQLAGEEVDERADIHAAGVLLSEMFCGGMPWPGDTTMEIYMAQVQGEPVRPSSLWPDIPPPLEALILRCIARRREDRFQSASELGEALAGLRA